MDTVPKNARTADNMSSKNSEWTSSASATRSALHDFDRAVYRFTAAERRLRWHFQRVRDPLPRGRLQALLTLLEQGEATPSQLAREAELNGATITAMIDELEERKLLRRRPDRADGRVWWVSLTAKGRAELSAVMEEWDERFTIAFTDISDKHLEIAGAVLDRLTAVFNDVSNGD
jgi:DNA-binding MarR family transcriptional regulator